MAELIAGSADSNIQEYGELTDVSIDNIEAYKRGYVDINFFASMALPHVMVSPLPAFYVLVWQILVMRDKCDIGRIMRFALGLPRGHAKTTFIKVIIAWLICYDKISFALLICSTEPLAEELLDDVNDILGSSNIEMVYGGWQECLTKDTKELKKAFYHGRPVILAAKGAGSSLRGLNIKHTRPDLVFCDDAQTRENDESPTERLRLLRWLVATLFKVIAVRGDRLIIYVGNMYSEECILRMFQKSNSWISLVTGAILSNGQPLWPELHSLESLMESYYHDEELGLADLWFAEVMNDPKGSATSLLNGPLPICPYEEDAIADGVFITIDPAGFRNGSDDNEIILHKVFDGFPYVAGRLSTATDKDLTNPKKLVEKALDMAIQTGASLIGVEDQGYQQTLLFWFNYFMEELKIAGIEIVALKPHGRTKETRIRQHISELYGGTYFIGPSVRAAYVWQATKYKIGAKKNRDDLLDACAYGQDIRNEYWHLVKNNLTLPRYTTHAVVVGNNTPF